MTEPGEAREFLRKAETALESAGLLLQAGDHEGACNRADYAMFDAARAALLAQGHHIGEATSKTHRGLIAAFGQKLVLEGTVDPVLGRAFNRMQDIRVRADYMRGSPTADDAEWAVSRAETFVAALREQFFAS